MHLNHSPLMVFLDTVSPASTRPVWVPIPFLWMPFVILKTALWTGNFRLINLAFLVPREMKLVSKLFFPCQAPELWCPLTIQKWSLWGARRSPRGRGLISPILLPLGAGDLGLSSCLKAGLYFRKDWTNLCPETGCKLFFFLLLFLSYISSAVDETQGLLIEKHSPAQPHPAASRGQLASFAT